MPARDARRSLPRGRRTGAAQRPRVGPRQFRQRQAPARAPPPSLRTTARHPSSRNRRDPAPRARLRNLNLRAASVPPPSRAPPMRDPARRGRGAGTSRAPRPVASPAAPPRARGGGDRSHKRLRARYGCERGRQERQPRLVSQRGAELETGDQETGDHGNVCSIPEQVFLSNISISNPQCRLRPECPPLPM